MMKDPSEHHNMLHENEDVKKRDCLKYKKIYGKHFNKKLCEWAVSEMENRDKSEHHYTHEDVKRLWAKHNLPDIHTANWHDVTYVMNMAYADYFGHLFTNHYECAMYAYLYLSDPDGYEGIAFSRWHADMEASDEEIMWHSFIEE